LDQDLRDQGTPELTRFVSSENLNGDASTASSREPAREATPSVLRRSARARASIRLALATAQTIAGPAGRRFRGAFNGGVRIGFWKRLTSIRCHSGASVGAGQGGDERTEA